MAFLIQRSLFPQEEVLRCQSRRCVQTEPQEAHCIEEKDAKHARML